MVAASGTLASSRMGRDLGLVLTILVGAPSFTCGCSMHDGTIYLTRRVCRGGAAVAVCGEQRGDVGVCSCHVQLLSRNIARQKILIKGQWSVVKTTKQVKVEPHGLCAAPIGCF